MTTFLLGMSIGFLLVCLLIRRWVKVEDLIDTAIKSFVVLLITKLFYFIVFGLTIYHFEHLQKLNTDDSRPKVNQEYFEGVRDTVDILKNLNSTWWFGDLVPDRVDKLELW